MNKPLVVRPAAGSYGDLQPLLTIAAAPKTRGCRTLPIVLRFDEKAVHETGVHPVTFGTHEQTRSVLGNPGFWHERRGFGVVRRCLLPSQDEIQTLIGAQPWQASQCVEQCRSLRVPG